MKRFFKFLWRHLRRVLIGLIAFIIFGIMVYGITELVKVFVPPSKPPVWLLISFAIVAISLLAWGLGGEIENDL